MIELNRVEKITTSVVLITIAVVASLVGSQLLTFSAQPSLPDGPPNTGDPEIPSENYTTYLPPNGSNIARAKQNGKITIRDVGTFNFNPNKIVTKRPDVFQDGYFSIFDIIAYLNKTEMITAEYHFDEEMNTYVIDTINGEGSWWYQAYYNGGWRESNAFRMDHYPVKDKMTIEVSKASLLQLNDIYSRFKRQIIRGSRSNSMVIPTVTVIGKQKTLTFENVVVEAHNLRTDMFKPGVITAIDVIMSLADQGKITYDLRWLPMVGTAEVKNYYVERVDDDESYGRCGFVYECGEKGHTGRNPYGSPIQFVLLNHIHIPADIRVINSPDYWTMFWICI